MVNFISKDRYAFEDLVALVRLLRAPGGCPWDAAQTHLSIRRNFLEEAYEACEGFDQDDPALMCEELGDVLLQVLFHADIEREAGRFDLDDICDGICKKLIFRHPALFGGQSSSWDEIKKLEKGQTTTAQTLDGVARSLPALWRAEKIQKKAAKSGFDWESVSDCLDKLQEEHAELHKAIAESSNVEEELGDVLFAAVNVAAKMQIDPEQALHRACEKFIRRFSAMEDHVLAGGRHLEELDADELLMLWNQQKYSDPNPTYKNELLDEKRNNHE